MTSYQQGFLTKCAEVGIPFAAAYGLMKIAIQPGMPKRANYSTAGDILRRIVADNAAVRQSRLQKKILGTFVGSSGLLLTLDKLLNKH